MSGPAIMSHYEERLERDLERIRERVAQAGIHVDEALRAAERTFRTGDRNLASETILGDHRINREIREIDKLCHAFVARHLPSAGHLRLVSSVLRINVELERIGDYAVTVCREAVQLTKPPPSSIFEDLEVMAEQGRTMLAQAMQAFREGNPDLARGTMAMAKQASALTHKMWQDLLREGEKESRPISDLFALLIILNRLERVSDQAKNICEETVFAATGETKEPKVYSVLFVDETNTRWSQIAEAYARKSYPESGVYRSAGWSPGTEIDEETRAFLHASGLDFDGASPTAIADLPAGLAEFDVVVGLGQNAHRHLDETPFHTTIVQWDISDEEAAPSLESGFAALTLEIRDLMETLRGPNAT